MKKQLQLENNLVIKNQAEAYVHFDKIIDAFEDLKQKYHLLKDENVKTRNSSTNVRINYNYYDGHIHTHLELGNRQYTYSISECDYYNQYNNHIDDEYVDKFLRTFKDEFMKNIMEVKQNVER